MLTDLFFFSSRRRHTRCALVTGVQTCALPISARCHVEIAFAPLRDVVELACLRGRPARRGHRIVIHFVLSPDILAGPGKRPRARGPIVESRTPSAYASATRTPEIPRMLCVCYDAGSTLVTATYGKQRPRVFGASRKSTRRTETETAR